VAPINRIWLALFFLGYVVAGATGRVEETTLALLASMEDSVKFAIGITGFLAFWSGLLRIAETAGLTQKIARALHPLLRRLFPRLPADSPALGAITLSLAANLLGLSHAATPLGIKTMRELEKVNATPGVVSDEMAVYLALILGGISLVPSTIIAVRSQAGSVRPSMVIIPILITASFGTAAALLTHFFIKKTRKERKK
jgi:spore maturation protein A